ncbi:MAG: cellobiose phosphorylase, partial [Candidatus Omnitrophica bacterium]|nr:cellobiose phosphorylase [Candidatus Omnitrophota bacterium]
FLEPQVHALRLNNGPAKARAIYKATRQSPLYDKELKMYKVTASLANMPHEIGRGRAFTRGWLEHESIWLHMEYKFILELLKNGLNEEFYENFKNVLIPFQKPVNYGRSILENSSFLVSSAFPDKKLHGNGYVARLSGSTAEFLQIWLTMNLGLKPFILSDKNELNFQLKPVLPGWLFTYSRKHKDFIYSFNFLSQVWITYRNAKRKNTFGRNSVKPKKIIFNDKDGNLVEIGSDTIPSPYAAQIRSRQIIHLEVILG